MKKIRDKIRLMLSDQKMEFPVADLGGRVSSLCTPTYLLLKDFLGYGNSLTNEKITLLNTISDFDERVLTVLNIPFRRLYLQPPTSFQEINVKEGTFKDEWGVTYKTAGYYNERIGHPLASATVEDLASFPWPDPNDPGRIDGLTEKAAKLSSGSDYSLVAGHISAGIFQDCWNLRGMERFFFDLVEERLFAEALLDKVTEIHIGFWKVFLLAVGEYVDIVETADDLGGQRGPIISPKMYREIIKPRHIALNSAIRELSNAKILYHSCGAILPLIPDLIDAGVNILNPIQPIPNLMEPEILNQRFGDQLIFHGGLDVQQLLSNGSTEQVKDHVRRYLNVFGPGRYIMAPSNTVQPGTPPENLVAAYQEIAAYYSLQN